MEEYSALIACSLILILASLCVSLWAKYRIARNRCSILEEENKTFRDEIDEKRRIIDSLNSNVQRLNKKLKDEQIRHVYSNEH